MSFLPGFVIVSTNLFTKSRRHKVTKGIFRVSLSLTDEAVYCARFFLSGLCCLNFSFLLVNGVVCFNWTLSHAL